MAEVNPHWLAGSSDADGMPSEIPPDDAELVRARQVLEELELAIESLPQILEQKYRQQLRAVEHVNQRLLLERQQLLAALEASQTQPALNAQTQRPRWLGSLDMAGFWLCLRRDRVAQGSLVVAGLILLAWGSIPMAPRLWQALGPLQRGLAPPSSSGRTHHRNGSPPSSSVLTLQARGSSWVEVQDLLSRQTLFVGMLEAGDTRLLNLRQGIRIRSGRPDLLSLQRDGQQPQQLAAIHGVGWHVIRPLDPAARP